jgi:hypothetical protein
MLFIVLIFLGVDVYYVAWAMQVKDVFPKSTLSYAIRNILFGFETKMKEEMYRVFNEGRLMASRRRSAP